MPRNALCPIVLSVCMITLCGCGNINGAASLDDDPLEDRKGDVRANAKGTGDSKPDSSSSNDKATDEFPLPDMELPPEMQRLADLVSAWGGTTESELGKLVSVNLASSRVVDEDLEKLQAAKNLDKLTLSNTGITDAGLAHLSEMTQLRQLHLDNTKITSAGLKPLENLSGLWNLRLSDTLVGDDGLGSLAKLKDLEMLSLDGTKITDAGLKDVAAVPLLRTLNLSRTSVSDDGIETLKKLRTVSTLYLEKTRVSREGVRDLQAALGVRCRIFAIEGGLSP